MDKFDNKMEYNDNTENKKERTEQTDIYMGSTDKKYDSFKRNIITPDVLYVFSLKKQWFLEHGEYICPESLTDIFNNRYNFFNRMFEDERFVMDNTTITEINKINNINTTPYFSIYEDYQILVYNHLLIPPYKVDILEEFIYSEACKNRSKILFKLKKLDLYFISFIAGEFPEIATNYRIIRRNK